jgi:hypothetical protein
MRQTPDTARLPRPDPEASRIDWYGGHLYDDGPLLPPDMRYLAADGAYAKQTVVDGVREFGLHLLGKLRQDANLRDRYTGPQQRRGRPKQDDGNVTFHDLSRFTPVSLSKTMTLYTAVVNSGCLTRTIRIVYLCKRQGPKLLTALLFCPDPDLAAEDISRYYTARFQIEFLFRDAKQCTGLADCQACSKASMPFHVNASMTALNFLKLEDRQSAADDTPHVLSIQSWNVRKFNEHHLERVISTLGFDLSSIKLHPHYEDLGNYGSMAA